MSDDSRLCPNCGQPTPAARAVCAHCGAPLTAYGGQVGQEENFQRRLATQVEALERRPPAVIASVVFQALFILAWPIAIMVAAWSHRVGLNKDETNYMAAAFGVLGPIMATAVFVPITALLAFVAYATYAQRTWAWTAGAALLVLAPVVSLIRFGFTFWTILWIVAALAIGWFWTRPATRAWFGLN